MSPLKIPGVPPKSYVSIQLQFPNIYFFFITAFVFQMVFLIITAYVMTPVAAVTCITIAVGVGGFAWAGFPVNHLDIAPQVYKI